MKEQKKIIILNLVILIVCFISSVILELQLDGIHGTIFSEHRAYIVNIFVCVFTGALVSMIAAIITYENRKKENITNYVLIAREANLKRLTVGMYISANIKNNTLSYSNILSDELEKILTEFYNLSQETYIKRLGISLFYNPKIIFKKNIQIITCIDKIDDMINELSNSAKYCLADIKEIKYSGKELNCSGEKRLNENLSKFGTIESDYLDDFNKIIELL